MAGPKKGSVKGKRKVQNKDNFSQAEFIDLISVIRGSKNKQWVDDAFSEIEYRMRQKIYHISYTFNIPGYSQQDIYQEALYALRYKAIKDYNEDRTSNYNQDEPYPFDKFAVLCIRRHLSTKLKSSCQHKKRILNSSLSLDQNRNDNSDESLFLADIIPDSEDSILDQLESDERYVLLFTRLLSKLSSFEKDVFALYVDKYSYEQIASYINNKRKTKQNNKEVNVKSVDNALSRIKTKAQNVYNKLEDFEK